jgi:hypothetical protein
MMPILPIVVNFSLVKAEACGWQKKTACFISLSMKDQWQNFLLKARMMTFVTASLSLLCG